MPHRQHAISCCMFNCVFVGYVMLHQPVLISEVLTQMIPTQEPGSPPRTILDATAGYGGHASQIYQQLSTGSSLILMDRDPQAVTYLQTQLLSWRELWCKQHAQQMDDAPKVILVCERFSQLKITLKDMGISHVHSILADLGVSSPQIDQGHRGFSFQRPGPLDMRMNPNDPITAYDVIHTASEEELAHMFWTYGEEPRSRRVAQAIVKKRSASSINTTTELAALVCDTIHYPRRSKRHPATRIFQALRIHINAELDELKTLLHESFELLCASTGRLGVISFHSLEDRLVKQHMKKLCLILPPDSDLSDHFSGPLGCPDQHPLPQAHLIKPFPIIASAHEIAKNPRSRSAKLRIIKRADHSLEQS